MQHFRLFAASAALALFVGPLFGCGGAPSTPSPEAASPSAEATAPAPSDGTHVGTYEVTGTPRVTVQTDRGSFVIETLPAKAPNTVSSFLELVSSGFYDGIRVHRVEPGFVMQAGDPLTKGLTAAQLAAVVQREQAGTPQPSDPPIGTGDPGWKLKAEFNNVPHERGVVAMARSTEIDSAGSQFYVTLAPARQLDGQYTVFGRVVSGMDVVDKLRVGDAIRKMTITPGR